MTNPIPLWTSDEQALKAGMLIGKMMQAGITCWIEADDEGNYLNEITISLDDGPPPVWVKIKVL